MRHGSVIDEAAEEEIELAIVIVIEPYGAGGPTRGEEAGLAGDVGEGAVAVIAVEDAIAVGGDEDIGPTVVIVVTDGHAHPEGPAGDSGLFGDVGEGAVAIVLVERIAQGLG